MFFNGEIIKETSYDPYFSVKFFYDADGVRIENGYAEIVRRAPKAEVTYDSDTAMKLQSIDKSKLEIELLNLILSYWLSKQVNKIKK